MSGSVKGWLKNISITGKLYSVMCIMAALIALELVILIFTIHTLSATRASIGGESLWSKAQKDAVYSLRCYASSGKEKDYEAFLEFLQVHEGDRLARVELEKENFDSRIVYEGFLKGRNHPDDIDGLINLFKRFRHNKYISKAIANWTIADDEILRISKEAIHLHQLISTGKSDSLSISRSIQRIDSMNRRLTQLEDEFSYTLAEGSRWLEDLVLRILFIVALSVELAGILLTISLSNALSKGINEIVRVADKVAKGDFSNRASIYSNDEIGHLARAFNNMIDELDRKINTLKKVDEDLRKQKDLYETLVTAQGEMGEGVSIMEDKKIIFANSAFCELYGYTKEEVLALNSFEDVVVEEDRERLGKRIAKKLSTGKMSDTGETRVQRKDGKIIDIEYALHTIYRENKHQVISIIRDITDRKKAESKFRGLLESAPDAMIIIDTEGRIQLVNARTEKLFGYSRKEIIKKEIDLLIPDHFEEGKNIFNETRNDERGIGRELTARKKDGSEFPAEVSFGPIETGEGILISTAIRDVSEKKFAEKALQEYAARLEESNKELEQFAYVASHDLREPLRTITSFVQLLQSRYQDKLGAEANEFIEFTVAGANRMNRLISDLLAYSRVGRQDSGFDKVDCEKVIAAVMAHLRETIHENKAVITYSSLPTLEGNELMLIQLFQNLISNAIKFHGTSPPEIHISAKKQKKQWLFSVRDNGIGIDQKFSEKIFIIFQRLHSGSMFEGTGIGLAICKKIVERHGGKIWFESEPGKGATFYFTIKENIQAPQTLV
ncbi:MAG: PAS domain S-box protein [Bacteroidia bacterium]